MLTPAPRAECRTLMSSENFTNRTLASDVAGQACLDREGATKLHSIIGSIRMSDDSSEWSPLESTTHQEHVIKHVVGATVLGWFIAGEAAHLLLDIGFLWTIYLDGAMNLLPQGVAISELDADELNGDRKAELTFDAELLLTEGRDA